MYMHAYTVLCVVMCVCIYMYVYVYVCCTYTMYIHMYVYICSVPNTYWSHKHFAEERLTQQLECSTAIAIISSVLFQQENRDYVCKLYIHACVYKTCMDGVKCMHNVYVHCIYMYNLHGHWQNGVHVHVCMYIHVYVHAYTARV